MRIKLEDLVAEPEARLRELCSYLELEWHEPMRYNPLDSRKVHRYRLDSQGQKAYDEHLAELAKEMGYEP